jgi:mono/diheme cytochrome c family protein
LWIVQGNLFSVVERQLERIKQMLIKVIFAFLVSAGAASAQEPTADGGRDLYMTYCVQCHGADAQGDGPMAEMLAIDTPDLTGLAFRNAGNFPTEAVVRQIDGRAPVLAHGGDMPVFGPFFARDKGFVLKLPSGQPMMTSLPLANLIVYLESIQAK